MKTLNYFCVVHQAYFVETAPDRKSPGLAVRRNASRNSITERVTTLYTYCRRKRPVINMFYIQTLIYRSFVLFYFSFSSKSPFLYATNFSLLSLPPILVSCLHAAWNYFRTPLPVLNYLCDIPKML